MPWKYFASLVARRSISVGWQMNSPFRRELPLCSILRSSRAKGGWWQAQESDGCSLRDSRWYRGPNINQMTAVIGARVRNVRLVPLCVYTVGISYFSDTSACECVCVNMRAASQSTLPPPPHTFTQRRANTGGGASRSINTMWTEKNSMIQNAILKRCE